jgi:predicted NBD/HSP70 family sugar kinase
MKPDDNIGDREATVARMLHESARAERAPLRLRAEVEDLSRRAAQRKPSASRRLVAVPMRIAAVTATSCAALAVVLVLLLGGGAAEPSLAAAAALATKGPTAAAPAPDPRAPTKLLEAHVGDLQFPNWEGQEGWRSTGKRVDKIGDRTVTTVFYAKDGKQIAYSIVSQPALKQPAVRGEPYATMHQNGRTVVVWTEDDHTCVLSASGISATELWQLAAASSST